MVTWSESQSVLEMVATMSPVGENLLTVESLSN